MADLVTTAAAAQLYGVTHTTLRRAMREANIAPVVRPSGSARGGVVFYWNPAEVLKVRSARLAKHAKAMAAFGARWKNPELKKVGRVVARHHAVESYRNRLLAPVALKRGMTVKELRIDLGIDKG